MPKKSFHRLLLLLSLGHLLALFARVESYYYCLPFAVWQLVRLLHMCAHLLIAYECVSYSELQLGILRDRATKMGSKRTRENRQPPKKTISIYYNNYTKIRGSKIDFSNPASRHYFSFPLAIPPRWTFASRSRLVKPKLLYFTVLFQPMDNLQP